MGARLFNRFAGGTPLRRIRAAWLNKVANLWNYARGGHCINWTVPDDPGPENGPRVDLDVAALDGELELRGFVKRDRVGGGVTYAELPGDDAAPEDWNTAAGDGLGDAQTRTGKDGKRETYYTGAGSSRRAAPIDHRHRSNLAPTGDDAAHGGRPLAAWKDGLSSGSTGASKYAARADHTHPGVCASDVPCLDGTSVEDALANAEKTIEDHGKRITALEGGGSEPGGGGSCGCAAKWTAQEAWNDGVDEALDAVTTEVGGTRKVPLTALTGAIGGHGAVRCFMTVEADGSIGHSNENGRDVALLSAAAGTEGATKLLTDADEVEADQVRYSETATVADALDEIREDLGLDGDGEPFTGTLNVCTDIKAVHSEAAGGNVLQFTTRQIGFSKGRIVSLGQERTWDDYSV